MGRNRHGAPARPIQPKALTITRTADGRWGDWGSITVGDGAVIPPKNGWRQQVEFSRTRIMDIPLKSPRVRAAQSIAMRNQPHSGIPVFARCRPHGSGAATLSKWRSEYGGVDATRISQRRERHDESRRLKMPPPKHTCAQTGSSRPWQKMARPSDRQTLALTAVQLGNTRLRPAWCTFRLSQGCARYQTSCDQDTHALAAWLIGLTQT